MIGIASDHAGFEYKEQIKALLKELKEECTDFGTHAPASTDYPDWGHAAAEAVSDGRCRYGILVCGTGIGMSIVANKHRGVRAAVCANTTQARLARAHNDANVLAIGERISGWETVRDIVQTFLSTPFEGGRHQRRVDKLERP
jgi:ribose 5-phosphate isomerase B